MPKPEREPLCFHLPLPTPRPGDRGKKRPLPARRELEGLTAANNAGAYLGKHRRHDLLLLPLLLVARLLLLLLGGQGVRQHVVEECGRGLQQPESLGLGHGRQRPLEVLETQVDQGTKLCIGALRLD